MCLEMWLLYFLVRNENIQIATGSTLKSIFWNVAQKQFMRFTSLFICNTWNKVIWMEWLKLFNLICKSLICFAKSLDEIVRCDYMLAYYTGITMQELFIIWKNTQKKPIISPQANDLQFNRAMLMNVGFQQALNFTKWDCFIFHDVYHLPLNDANYYGCSHMPRHFISGADRWDYRWASNNNLLI